MANTTVEDKDPIGALALLEDEQIAHVSVGAVGAIVRSEVQAQIEAAHRFPRSVTRFLTEAVTLATINEETAESCMYTLERFDSQTRKKKLIIGPSVRLAEIVASAYGNLHAGARVVAEDERMITAQGTAWDTQKNVYISLESQRRITNKEGKKYSDDMIVMTGNAAASIALRNAIFRVIPRAYVDQIFHRARAVAVGDVKSLGAKRQIVLERLQKMGVSLERVLAKLEVKGADDIGLEQMEILIGLGTSLKSGEAHVEDVFPLPVAPPSPAPAGEDGKRMNLGSKKEPDGGKTP